MEAAQGGDRAAYERLLTALAPAIRGVVARRIRDADAAEDVVQQVLISIHRARHTYRPERPFGPWWRAIARHAVIDALRAQQRRAAREDRRADPDALVADVLPAPPERADPALAAALATLSDGQREAVELVYLRELSIAEAAERAGVTPGALKVRVHRGLQALRGRLKRELP